VFDGVDLGVVVCFEMRMVEFFWLVMYFVVMYYVIIGGEEEIG